MALSDLSRVLDLPAERWLALGARLQELGVPALHDRVTSIGASLFPPACLPLRRWYLRRGDQPADRAVRLFCLGDSLTAEEARSALGDALTRELTAVGVLVPEGDRLVSPLRLIAHEGLLFFTDHLEHGGDAVMGMGPLTVRLLEAALPARRVPRSLDLGCGAGVVALLLARHSDLVVAADINPRAITLTRVNAALNGVPNVEVRTGDLFTPVAGERFDRILCQPPFFPTPEGLDTATYCHGGRRGDEIVKRLLAELPAHLAPKGRAAVMAEWPVLDEEPLARRVRGLVAQGVNLLVIESEGPDVDAFCMGDTAFAHPDFGAEYQRNVVLQREHMERLGIRGLRVSLLIVEPAAAATPAAAEGWTGTLEVRDLLRTSLSEPLVDGLVAAHALIHRGREALLAANLRLREGAVFASGKEGLVRVLLSAWEPPLEIKLDRGAHRIVELVDAAPNVRAAAKRFGKEASGARSFPIERFAEVVETMLLAGILEIASPA